MALFTTADRDAIKAALITAAAEGFASVSIGGQNVQTYSLDELRKILDMVLADLSGPSTGFGMRRVKTIPPSSG